MAKSPVYYSVKPRYTAGSPAQVDFETACRVADEEKQAIEAHLEGIYGQEYTTRAETLGLGGIVEERTEKSDCWLITDLLTGSQFIRLFPQDVPNPNPALLSESRKHWNRIARLEAKYRLRVVK